MDLETNQTTEKRMARSFAVLDSSPSSSTDSSSSFSTIQYLTLGNTDFTRRRRGTDRSSDLKLGLRISLNPTGNGDHSPSFSTSVATNPAYWEQDDSRDYSVMNQPAWHNNGDGRPDQPSFFFVKVFMEGMPIGRKLNLYANHSYDDLVATLSQTFTTTIHGFKDADDPGDHSMNHCHVLTYQDSDGDWMMVGDVPWELFLTTVKRLKLTRPFSCCHQS